MHGSFPYWRPSALMSARLAAQSSLEYVVVIGALVVVMVAGLAGFKLLLPELVGVVCPTIDVAATPTPSDGSCLGPH